MAEAQGHPQSVEPARPEDARAIVELFRSGFDPALLELMIHGCRGADLFVAAQVRLGTFSPNRYLVVREGGRPCAAAELKRLPEGLFLNYIAVAPSARGRGLAKALLQRALQQAREDNLLRFGLDVFASNEPAIQLYRGMGFTADSARGHWARAAARGGASGHRLVLDLPQADAVHERFGFSEIALRLGSELWRVGRLGKRYFRLTDPAMASHAALLAFLSELEPVREFLAVGERPRDGASWRLVAESHRMWREVTS